MSTVKSEQITMLQEELRALTTQVSRQKRNPGTVEACSVTIYKF